MTSRIALIGDFDPSVTAHRAIPAAVRLAARSLGASVVGEWVGTDTLNAHDPDLDRFDGVWCVPASPYRSTDAALAAIRLARESGRPFLGTCGGFQHAILECAASIWGVEGAAHAELDTRAAGPVISELACSLVEQRSSVRFLPGSRLAEAYGGPSAVEAYHCSYGLSSEYRHHLDDGPLRATAWDDDGDVRGVELDGHRFFVATLFQPERAALYDETPPVVAAFVDAVARRAVCRARTTGGRK